MIRYGLLLVLLGLLGRAKAQCVIAKDAKGRVTTTCQTYASGNSQANMHREVTYLGTAYFTFPVWQEARVELGGREIPCTLAFNLNSQEVEYKLDHAETPERIQPEGFTVNGYRFVRRAIAGPSSYKLYLMVVRDGQTKLLKHLKSELKLDQEGNGYTKADHFQGHFEQKETYFIQKGNAYPQSVKFTARSVLAVLSDQAAALSARLPAGKLSLENVIGALSAYDSLTAASPAHGPALSHDPLFNQQLKAKISYPAQAWNERVYSRVYAGFEIDARGQVRDIVLLSPDNAGYGFDYEVKQALRKMPPLKPEYAGKYVLPVAFTYTNTREKQPTLVPVNKLPPERIGNRVELTELTVPASVAKSSNPGAESREVWGYFK